MFRGVPADVATGVGACVGGDVGLGVATGVGAGVGAGVALSVQEIANTTNPITDSDTIRDHPSFFFI